MDNCGEELFKYIKNNREKYNNIKKIVELMIQMCECIKVIHDVGYMYLDFKPQNFLIDDNENIKLIDFGLILKKNTILNFPCGTPIYMSPRILYLYLKRKSSIEILPDLDLFSIGCFFLEMIYYCIFNEYYIYEDKTLAYSSLPLYKSKMVSNIFIRRISYYENKSSILDEIINKLIPSKKFSTDDIIKIISIIMICISSHKKQYTIDHLIREFNKLLYFKYINSNNLGNIFNIMHNLCNAIINNTKFYNNITSKKLCFSPNVFYIINGQIKVKNNVDKDTDVDTDVDRYVDRDVDTDVDTDVDRDISKDIYKYTGINTYTGSSNNRIKEFYKPPDSFDNPPESNKLISLEQKYIFSLGCFLIGMICTEIYNRPTFFNDSMVCPIKIDFKDKISEKRNKYTDEKHRQNLNKINCRLITSGHSKDVSNSVCDIIDKMVNPYSEYSYRYINIVTIINDINILIQLIKRNNEKSVTLKNSPECSIQDGFNKNKEINSFFSKSKSLLKSLITKRQPKNGIYKPKIK